MALLTIDESKFEEFLEEYRGYDDANDYDQITEPLWARVELDDSDMRHMVDKASEMGLIRSTRPDVSVKLYFEPDMDLDGYASLALFIEAGENYWPSVNSRSQRIKSWMGDETITWEDGTRHMIAEVVRMSNFTFDRITRMVREFPAVFPDA